MGRWVDLPKFQEGLCTRFKVHGLNPLGSMSWEAHKKSVLAYWMCTPTPSRPDASRKISCSPKCSKYEAGHQTSHWLWSPERAHPAGRATYCSCVSIYMTPSILACTCARARARERNSLTKKIKYILNYWFCYIEFSSPMRVSLVYHARSSCCKHAESPESPINDWLLGELDVSAWAPSAQNMKLDIKRRICAALALVAWACPSSRPSNLLLMRLDIHDAQRPCMHVRASARGKEIPWQKKIKYILIGFVISSLVLRCASI